MRPLIRQEYKLAAILDNASVQARAVHLKTPSVYNSKAAKMHGRNLVGAATRYIAGRNAAQTVYWRGVKNSSDKPKFMKVLRTVQFAKGESSSYGPPAKITQEHSMRF